MAKRRFSPHKRRAITALEDAAREQLGPSANVGRLQWLGEGTARKAWFAVIDAPGGSEHVWVAQVPPADTSKEALDRFARELALLGALADLDLPFHTPAPITSVEVDGIPINITTACDGAALDVRMRIFTAAEAAQFTGEVAAAIHRLPTHLPLPGKAHRTCREDALHDMSALRDIDAPFVDELEAWCTEHLPPDDLPSCVVHGDLLGQNLLLTWERAVSVIDWEYAGLGSPAGDLAIVTRGHRKVFRDEDGRAMLLDAYNAKADRPVRPADLRLRELTLMAFQVAEFLREYPHSGPTELNKLKNLYKRPV